MSANAVGSPRRVSEYAVTYPTLPSLTDTLPTPENIQIIQKQYHHDVAIINFPLPNDSALKNLNTGVPVHISWTSNHQKVEWVGYVSHVVHEHVATPKKRLEIHCVGSSFPLKTRVSQVFSNKTIPQVAALIAKEHSLKFIGDTHPRIFKQLAISGQSQWEWLQQNAKKIGFGLVIDGTTMYFSRLDNLITSFTKNTPVLSYFADEFPTDFAYFDRTLDYFKVLSGEYLDGVDRRTTKNVGGIDPVTGKPIASTKKPNKVGINVKTTVSDVIFTEQKTDLVVHDSLEASTAAEGSAQSSRFSVPASIKCQGDPRIRPFATVYVDGISSNIDGHWVVTEAKHYLTITGEYQIEARVASDGFGRNATSKVRSTSPNNTGKVDVEAALATKNTKRGKLNKKTTLTKKAPILSETHQGFNRTPVKWESKPVPPKKGRK